MITWLLRLYPRAWRRRYGAEFVTLLEGQHLTPTVLFDVARGALDAHYRDWEAMIGTSGVARFWRHWVALHAIVGLVTGLTYFLVPGMLARPLPRTLTWPFGYAVDREWYVWSGVTVLCLMLLLATTVVQWRLLQRLLPSLDRWWVGATAAATIATLAIVTSRDSYGRLPDALTMTRFALGRLGMPSVVAIRQLYPILLTVGYFFGLTALAQSLVLQRATRGAAWWIPISMAAAFAGVATVRALMLLPGLHGTAPYSPAAVSLGANAVLTTTAYAAYGAVTGVGLLWLARAQGHSVVRGRTTSSGAPQA